MDKSREEMKDGVYEPHSSSQQFPCSSTTRKQRNDSPLHHPQSPQRTAQKEQRSPQCLEELWAGNRDVSSDAGIPVAQHQVKVMDVPVWTPVKIDAVGPEGLAS